MRIVPIVLICLIAGLIFFSGCIEKPEKPTEALAPQAAPKEVTEEQPANESNITVPEFENLDTDFGEVI